MSRTTEIRKRYEALRNSSGQEPITYGTRRSPRNPSSSSSRSSEAPQESNVLYRNPSYAVQESPYRPLSYYIDGGLDTAGVLTESGDLMFPCDENASITEGTGYSAFCDPRIGLFDVLEASTKGELSPESKEALKTAKNSQKDQAPMEDTVPAEQASLPPSGKSE